MPLHNLRETYEQTEHVGCQGVRTHRLLRTKQSIQVLVHKRFQGCFCFSHICSNLVLLHHYCLPWSPIGVSPDQHTNFLYLFPNTLPAVLIWASNNDWLSQFFLKLLFHFSIFFGGKVGCRHLLHLCIFIHVPLSHRYFNSSIYRRYWGLVSLNWELDSSNDSAHWYSPRNSEQLL